MELLTLFAKKMPTVDPIDLMHGMMHKKDTVLYRDAGCTQLVARWPWHYSSCPRRGRATAVVNCWRWKLVWLS